MSRGQENIDPFACPDGIEIIAHRGFSARAPENTAAALALGLAAGADAVEFDLHPASDGTPYLMHDPTLDRTTDGTGRIGDASPEALAGLDAGSWFSDDFLGEPVPTLTSIMSAMKGQAGRVYAEVKRTDRLEDMDRVVSAVAGLNMLDGTVFISMDWDALDAIRTVCPTALVGYIVEDSQRAPGAIARAYGDPRALLDFDARILASDPSLAEQCHERRIALACWTVNEARHAQLLLDLGVPRITTNEVEALVAWKKDALEMAYGAASD